MAADALACYIARSSPATVLTSKNKHLPWGSSMRKKLTLLRGKFFRGNINIYLHFMSLPHIDMTQVLKILPQVRPGLTYST